MAGLKCILRNCSLTEVSKESFGQLCFVFVLPFLKGNHALVSRFRDAYVTTECAVLVECVSVTPWDHTTWNIHTCISPVINAVTRLHWAINLFWNTAILSSICKHGVSRLKSLIVSLWSIGELYRMVVLYVIERMVFDSLVLNGSVFNGLSLMVAFIGVCLHLHTKHIGSCK